MSESRILTLPNVVSSSRVMLAFGFLAYDAVSMRIALIFAASLTDFLDGWIARRTKVASRLGALVDPIADRLFVLSVVVAYLISGQFNAWHAVGVMFRDVMVVIGWFVARNVSWLRPIPFMARPVGKLVTVFQIFAFLAVLLKPEWVNVLVVVATVLGIVATVDYTLMLWRERTPKHLRT